MKRISYSPDIVVVKKASPTRVPIEVLAEQVRASMAIEGRIVVTDLTVKHTRESAKAVSDIAARSIARRESRGGMKA